MHSFKKGDETPQKKRNTVNPSGVSLAILGGQDHLTINHYNTLKRLSESSDEKSPNKIVDIRV